MSGHEHERLSAYLDGELAPEDRASVEAHLSVCSECASLLAALGSVDEAAAALPVEPPEGYFEAFAGRVRARLRPSRRLPVWAWAAAAALVLAVVTPLTLRETRRAPLEPPPAASLSAPAVTPAAPAADAVSPVPLAQAAPAAPTTLAAAPARGPASLPAGPPPDEAEPAKRQALQAPLESRERLHEEPEEQEQKAKEEVGFAAEPEGPPSLAPALARAAGAEGSAGAAPGDARRDRTRAAAAEPMAAAPALSATAVAPPAFNEADEDARAFRRLNATEPRSAEEWRRQRDAWNEFATAHPRSPRADEARVRAVEAAWEAWRSGRLPSDEEIFRREARAYLEREDALQKERVRRLQP